jgi:UPF0755 protein
MADPSLKRLERSRKRRQREAWRAQALLLLVVLAALAFDAWRQLHTPLNLAQATTFELAPGQSLDSLLRALAASDRFANARQRFYLSVYARSSRADSRLRAGEYALAPGATPLTLLRELIEGKPVLHELRLTEGWRFDQIWQALKANPDLSHTLGDVKRSSLMQALGLPAGDPEGQFFPDTYRFPKNTSDAAFLRHAYQAMQKVLGQEWQGRAPNLPLDTPAQALILASLIEKETAQANERAEIAGVFVRRLQLGMRLQTDPSVIYGLGNAFDGNLRLADLRRDTPYNTYTRTGLPPTPICSPGRESIHAALHPDGGKALYFVARGDGSHQFSDTLEGHDAAVRLYQLGSRHGDE